MLPNKGGLFMEWAANEQNGKVTVTVKRPNDGSGLFRAYAVGRGGGRLLLGTLTPQGGLLTLTRTLSADALKQRGCYPVAGVDAVLAQSFAPAPVPSPPFPDDILSAAFARSPRGRQERDGEGFALTFPYDPAAPFPMVPIFCFACFSCRDHRFYIRYTFDKEGNPRLPAYNPAEL